MKINTLWASVALSSAPAVLAQSTTNSAAASTTSSASSCTASLITKICDYPSPGPEFAVASSGKEFCWEYCNKHTPCSFVIFVAGNPYTGTGTCWVYPGKTFDQSAASTDCGNPSLYVFDQPKCDGGSATTTAADACTATATPSAVASVCGYPTPSDDCFSECSASSGASDCLSQCVEADSCNFVVFNPHNPSNSPYADGTCWMYSNGTYDDKAATECKGNPEQFVYSNSCPKPKTTSSSAVSTTGSTATGSSSDSTEPTGASKDSSKDNGNSASVALSRNNPLFMGMAVLLWQGF